MKPLRRYPTTYSVEPEISAHFLCISTFCQLRPRATAPLGYYADFTVTVIIYLISTSTYFENYKQLGHLKILRLQKTTSA